MTVETVPRVPTKTHISVMAAVWTGGSRSTDDIIGFQSEPPPSPVGRARADICVTRRSVNALAGAVV